MIFVSPRQPSRPVTKRIAVWSFIAMSALALTLLFSNNPAAADHDSTYVVCPDPILEGNSANMRVRKSGYDVQYLYAFTYQTKKNSADENDFEAYHGKKFTGTSDSNSLYVPVITKEDDRPEHNETFVVGYWDDDELHGCKIRIIDDDVPEVANIQITSKPVRNFTYFADDAIDVTVTFNQPVEADANAQLALFVGDQDESTYRGASYYQGSGTPHLTFRYRVQPADSDPDGISVSSAGMDIDRNPTHGFSGGIHVKGTDIPVDYDHGGIPSASHHQIDGRPIALNTRIISSPPDPWKAYRANQIIEVEFNYNIDVEIEGEPTIGIGLGWDGSNHEAATREAAYLRGSGTDTLVFGYTVTPGDNDDRGVVIFMGLPTYGYGGEGTIKARGTDIERSPYYLGSGYQPNHKVDTTPPRINSVAIESRPRNGESYDIGEIISLKVEFSEKVIIDGAPHVNVDIGGMNRHATLQSDVRSSSGYVDAAIFQYQVQPGDSDDDGIGLFANSFILNDAGIHDRAGIGLGLTHAAIAAAPGQRVDTSAD